MTDDVRVPLRAFAATEELDAAALAEAPVRWPRPEALTARVDWKPAPAAAAAEALGLDSLRGADLGSIEALDPVLRRRARHVETENERVREAVSAIGARDWARLGAVLDASHVSMRDDFEISCRELDLAVETAQGAGALGARMTGGGFGGSAVALVPAAEVPAVRRAVSAAFADAGLVAPAFLIATPSGSARVEPGSPT